jgi:4-amino-4-deoxy-L-arabinose transferase-like glycosyltransferase
MDSVAIRVFAFSILPVIIAVGHLGLDRSSRRRERRLEIFLLYLFGVGVAGSGIGGFFGHFFISDSVAESIGWPTGNPFQLEVGIANLAVGTLGVIAMGRRDGSREATVIAATVFGVGATVVHVMDVIESANLAPGNTLQNVSNLLRPALLIAFLAASRRAERSPDSEAQTSGFDRWRGPKDPCRRVDDRERRRRVRWRLCHRPAGHRYARWDPGWRRPGRLRRRSFIQREQRSPH